MDVGISKNEVNKEGSRVILCNPVCLKRCMDRGLHMTLDPSLFT